MNLTRGATEGAGNTKLEERIFLRSKASKSTNFVFGSWFRPVSERSLNGMEEAAYR